MIEYRYRDGFQSKVPAQILGSHIEDLRKRNATAEEPDGFLSPAEVVDDARRPESPIHRCFTWNQAEAARQYNLDQARYLLRCYEVHLIAPNVEPIIYSPGSVQVTRPQGGRSYVSSTTAMSNVDYRKQVLKDTISQLDGMKERLRKLTGLSPEIIATIDRLKNLLEKQAQARKKAQPVVRA